jgi:hypothetical protein
MRFAFRAVAVLIALAVLAVAVWALLSPRNITVNVVNDSRKPIAWVKVVDERGSYQLDGIAVAKSRVFRFEPQGETTYSLVVGFEDGSELRGGAVYAVAGYVFNATVSETSISNHLERFEHF